MDIHERMAAQALDLLGVPFRLHGRSRTTGLDCVGLAALAAQQAGIHIDRLPAYQLRGMSLRSAEAALRSAGFEPADAAGEGYLLMAQSGPMQLHLMIQTHRGLVHADAGLGRVVLMPLPSPWPILGQWRPSVSNIGG